LTRRSAFTLCVMRHIRSHPIPALAASAHELEQAAASLPTHAVPADAMSTYGVTLEHVEQAVDRLAVALDQMAIAIAEWCGESDAGLHEPALPPEARALRWHLHGAAANLRTAEAACTASRAWSHRLLAAVMDSGDVPRVEDRAAPA
jgi:hypothetical protein